MNTPTMRIQIMEDGTEVILAETARVHLDAVAVVEVDMRRVRGLVDRAADNVTGKARAGGGMVVAKTLRHKRAFRVRYTPDPSRPATRGKKSVALNAFSGGAALKSARSLFEKGFADRYNVRRDELTIEEVGLGT